MKKTIAAVLAALLLLLISCPALAASTGTTQSQENTSPFTDIPAGNLTVADMKFNNSGLPETIYNIDGIKINYTGTNFYEDTEFLCIEVDVKNDSATKK